MKSTIAIAQTTSSSTPSDNLILAEQFIKDAKEKQSDLIIFPEYFMCYFPSKAYVSLAQSLNGAFVTKMKELAITYGVWILFGMNESATSSQCFNTMVLLSDQGDIKGTYQKTHLFDAFSFKESEQTLPGHQLFEPVKTPFGTIGIGVCYDLRFPELARYEALYGCDMMCYPSAWVKGKNKYLQWGSLLKARAIENGFFTIGCCHYSNDLYMGQSLVIAPDGVTLAKGKEQQELIVCSIDTDMVSTIRSQVPSLHSRRSDLY